MTTLSWAVIYEGPSDSAYFGIIIPRLMQELVNSIGSEISTSIPSTPATILGERDRSRMALAQEICENRESFKVLFMHSDAGGRSLQAGLASRTSAVLQAAEQLCGWPVDQGVVIAPVREMEAWALADNAALRRALGVSDRCQVAFPRDGRHVERIDDPKAELDRICAEISGRRRPRRGIHILPSIAQEQSLSRLRECNSFRNFEADLVRALTQLSIVA